MTDRLEPDPEAPAGVSREPWVPAGRASSLAWSLTRDDAPDVEAGVPYLAGRVTRAGIFSRIDPSEPGTLWNRWRWAGLAFWAAVVGGALAKAWRDAGGPGGNGEG